MGWKGFVGGALSSAGKSALEYLDREDRQVHDMERMDKQQELEMQKLEQTKRLAKELADEERQAKAKRISTAKEEIIDRLIGSKYADSDAAVAAADRGQTDMPLTDEQRKTIAMAKVNDRSSLASDPTIAVEAGMRTGDIDFKEYAAIISQERANRIKERQQSWKESVDEQRLLLQERGLDIRDRQVNAMVAKMASAGNGGGSVAAFVQEFDKIKAETKWAPDKILEYMNRAKTPVESYSETTKSDPLTGTQTSVTRRGAGTPKPADNKLDSLFPKRN